MQPTFSRMIQMDDWIFEIKMVRALKVRKHGEPYSAVATMTANGESMYIDTQMTRSEDDFSRRDFMTFYRFCQSLDMKSVSYDKMRDGKRHSRHIDIVENANPKPIVRLVK